MNCMEFSLLSLVCNAGILGESFSKFLREVVLSPARVKQSRNNQPTDGVSHAGRPESSVTSL
jgi:hypothetical protein